MEERWGRRGLEDAFEERSTARATFFIFFWLLSDFLFVLDQELSRPPVHPGTHSYDLTRVVVGRRSQVEMDVQYLVSSVQVPMSQGTRGCGYIR